MIPTRTPGSPLLESWRELYGTPLDVRPHGVHAIALLLVQVDGAGRLIATVRTSDGRRAAIDVNEIPPHLETWASLSARERAQLTKAYAEHEESRRRSATR